ncbi:hypothetical protein CSUI_001564 [Cystoisospora suis]|uniref:Transmembrane protein n=1 Tax=Cystoisospora suis TaxID=483139 RepID=A0A2C6LCA1_9APIC|nr:hypothetical protein CSUI_001564 [Cystoisospora suis]
MRPVSVAMPRGFLLFAALVSSQLGRQLYFLGPCYSVASCPCFRGQSTGPTVTFSSSLERILPTPSLCLASFSFSPVSVVRSPAAVFQAFLFCPSLRHSSRQCVRFPSAIDAACASSFRLVCKFALKLWSPLLSHSLALAAAFRRRQCTDRPLSPKTVNLLKAGERCLSVSLHPRARTPVSNHRWSPEENTIFSQTLACGDKTFPRALQRR